MEKTKLDILADALTEAGHEPSKRYCDHLVLSFMTSAGVDEEQDQLDGQDILTEVQSIVSPLGGTCSWKPGQYDVLGDCHQDLVVEEYPRDTLRRPRTDRWSVFYEGSSSLMGPHYCVRFKGGGDEQVRVSMKRVGVDKRDENRRWAPLCDSCDLKQCPEPCAALLGEGK